MAINFYFTYNNIDSRDCNIHITSIPDRIIPSKKSSTADYNNIDGQTIRIFDTFQAISIPVECKIFYKDVNDLVLKNVYKIINTKEGQLSFSWDNEYFYNVKILENINIIEDDFKGSLAFTINFTTTEPFRYLKTGLNYIDFTNKITINSNINNIDSLPIFKLKVTDEEPININIKNDEKYIVLDNISSNTGIIYVDLNKLQIYGENKNLNNHLSLDYNLEDLILHKGNNVIEITGGNFIIKSIQPNWRII